MKLCPYIFLTFCYLFGAVPLKAQTKQLTTEDGLSQGYISSIIQDREGFLWFGTLNGLNRYDGYGYEVFKHNLLDSFSLSGNEVNSLLEWGDYLLVGTIGHGLNAYHKKTRRFSHVWAAGILGDWLRNCSVTLLQTKADDEIWLKVRTKSKKFHLVKMGLAFGKTNKLEAVLKRQWQIPFSFKTASSPNGEHLWGNWKGSAFRYNSQSDSIEVFPLPLNIRSLLALDNGKLLVTGRTYKIGLFNGENWQWEATVFDGHRMAQSVVGNSLWVGSSNGDVLRFPLKTTIQNLDFSQPETTIDLKGKRHTAILTDNSGNLWFGTNGYGLVKYNSRQENFVRYYEGNSIMTPVLIDRNGLFMCARYDDFAWMEIPPHHSLEQFPHSEKQQVTLGIDPKGTEWAVAINDDELEIFRKDGNWKKLTSTHFIKEGWQRKFSQLAFSENGHLWIAVWGKLINYRPESGDLLEFPFDDLLPHLYEVMALTQTADGSWWVGTNRGLLRAEPTKQGLNLQLFKSQKGEPEGLLNDHVSHLLTDPTDGSMLWVTSLGGGLTRLDVSLMEFEHFSLPDDVIYSILPDDKGYFWMSSNQGLIRFSPTEREVRNFTVDDGLASNEFNRRAYGKAPDGTLYFGGVLGMVSFHPHDISKNPITPPVRFTGLWVNNEKVHFGDSSGILKQALDFSESIELPYAQNSLSIEFAGMEFSAPEKNRFRYYLKGAEKTWAHESSEHLVSYLNLPPGKYTFMVKASNNDGLWHDEVTSLDINILPPWWQTKVAYFGYILVIFSIGFGIFYFFFKRQRLKHRLALEAKEAERLKELDAFKSKVYTNITHEFRTPLTIINGMADGLMEKNANVEKSSSLIKHNGEKMLRLINQMLDLAKMEEGSLPFRPKMGDIVTFLDYLVSSFQSLAEEKTIELHFQPEMDSFQMPFDKEHIQAVVTNLLSNALKFTPGGGKVLVGLGMSYVEKTSLLHITVSDTGSGIAPADLPHIFNRFYQVENAASKIYPDQVVAGSGIGLSLTKELVNRMDGEISVESEVGNGAVFTIVLPVKNYDFQTKKNGGFGAGHEQSLENKTFHNELPQTPNADLQLPTLLIVEDNPGITEYLLACVTGKYRVFLAQNGQEGIDMAQELVPDIILSDVMMPVKDGYALVHELKNDERTSHIPIILLTAKVDDASRIEGLEKGADAYLTKPFNKQELLVRLRKLLELRKTLQQRFSTWQSSFEGSKYSDGKHKLEDAFIGKVQSAVLANLDDERFGINELCLAVGVGRTQLYNKIKALTGKSTSIYIRSLRLQKARELLLTTDLNVSEVAMEVGFKYRQHFSKYYIEEFGVSPSKTRS